MSTVQVQLHTKTSEKGPCKHLACTATPARRWKDTLIYYDSPEACQSAVEERDSEIVDETHPSGSSSTQSDQNDLVAESESTPPQTKRRIKFNHKRDSR